MQNVILACEILEDEINEALAAAGNTDPIRWFDSSLHMFPQKLNQRLQEEIDLLDAQGKAENILFSFGYCGNAVNGLVSKRSNLIIPRVNDCIDLFLHKSQDISKIRTQGCYFLTRGWMKSPFSIVNEYDRYIERYGAARTKRIMDVMLAQYHYLTMIDTKSYPLDESIPAAKAAAEKLGLDLSHLDGSIDLLTKLFSAQWDDDFLIIPAGTSITIDHFSQVDLSVSQGQIG